ncbi:hypothetical protein HER32_04225 [Hymenobacter sp. BT18]|nr:hypothetical protein HER32_04225 [Hymenobacter sp. BT18]
MITYELPTGFTRLSGEVGLDQAGAAQNTGGTVRFLVFTKNPYRPMPADSSRVHVALESLGLQGPCTVRDLWAGKNLGPVTGEFAPYIRRHGAGFYRISAVKK